MIPTSWEVNGGGGGEKGGLRSSRITHLVRNEKRAHLKTKAKQKLSSGNKC